LEAERRHFGHHNNSGPAQHDRCRICFELDLLAQRKDRHLVCRESIFSGWPVVQAVDQERFNVRAPR